MPLRLPTNRTRIFLQRMEPAQAMTGEHRLILTRVDPNELVDELMNGINFSDKAATEG